MAEVELDIDGAVGKGINYDALTGPIAVGDRVAVNTTAVDLGLGSGGRHFVLWNLARPQFVDEGPGHLMKLRYTPLQHANLSVEEPDSPHHKNLRDIVGIEGLPVIACGLHSQLLPVAVTLRALNPALKVAYVMTDGGALPAKFSRHTAWLRREGYLSSVITAGQAFGGDLEAVNLYSAIAAAKAVVGADIAVVGMGPGIAGTGTALGHTGIEQGQIINAAHALGGRPVMILRLGQADKRRRHQGISHHSLTALTLVALGPAVVPVPIFGDGLKDLRALIGEQIEQAKIPDRHEVREVDSDITLALLQSLSAAGGPTASTMGRGLWEEPAFFLAAGAAATAAFDLL